MKITFDSPSNSAYVAVRPIADGEVFRTVELQPGRARVDLDGTGAVVGVEVLDVGPNYHGQALTFLGEALRRCRWTGERS